MILNMIGYGAGFWIGAALFPVSDLTLAVLAGSVVYWIVSAVPTEEAQ